MGVRITTWNVNGIRNPFGYQPWRDKRTFDGMFDILEADIVIMQELKIQRKDLRDDMVLVPGWDCYFSLPKHKKGYSGVGIYTRQSVCAPIRAEEGVLGVLSPPGSSTAYCDLPSDQHIGGYLSDDQLESLGVDAAALDAEGRCVVLEFPAFVIFGIYSPANSSGNRDDFRYGFLNALDMRVRNLINEGKRVIVTGDLNVSRNESDTAGAVEDMRKEGVTHEQYLSTPNRRIFNQLLEGGEVFGARDEGREKPVLWDICRGFHPDRTGMFTHWEQKINARPGNYGSRIDFILCSLEMKSWFHGSNIQEGLMGSDHCPVYAVIKDEVNLRGLETAIKDILNTPGTFQDGKRLKEYSIKDIPAFSGKLLPEFDKRRSIKDMFGKKPSLFKTQSSAATESAAGTPMEIAATSSAGGSGHDAVNKDNIMCDPNETAQPAKDTPLVVTAQPNRTSSPEKKRKASDIPLTTPKRAKSAFKQAAEKPSTKNQQSLKGFFVTKSPAKTPSKTAIAAEVTPIEDKLASELAPRDASLRTVPAGDDGPQPPHGRPAIPPSDRKPATAELPSPEKFVDPIVSKESWSKMFTKPTAPRCEHDEPCKIMKTLKKGFNCGREFYMCQRPLGPSGAKERGSQWRCPTFIWSSDWNNTTEQRAQS